MPEKLDVPAMQALEVKFSGDKMDNGEFRFRLMKGGYGYILTEVPAEGPGGWQNSHYHGGAYETYIVQTGWIASAELLESGFMRVQLHKPGDLPYTAWPGRPHNIYMPAGAVIHTVKHGDCSLEKDWIASPELDQRTKGLRETDIIRLAKETAPRATI